MHLFGSRIWWPRFAESEPSIRRQQRAHAARRRLTCLITFPTIRSRRFFGGPDQSLTNLILQFKKAKVDNRIKAILLDINMSGAGWGKSEEIRDAIADFRSSGKPVYAYMEFGLNKEYYIATACDKIYRAPPGELFINGLAADVMFFRGSLDKLGIYPDMYQIGKYKSAGDMFTQKEMTEAHREYINSLLDDLFNRYVKAIAQGARQDSRKKCAR